MGLNFQRCLWSSFKSFHFGWNSNKISPRKDSMFDITNLPQYFLSKFMKVIKEAPLLRWANFWVFRGNRNVWGEFSSIRDDKGFLLNEEQWFSLGGAIFFWRAGSLWHYFIKNVCYIRNELKFGWFQSFLELLEFHYENKKFNLSPLISRVISISKGRLKELCYNKYPFSFHKGIKLETPCMLFLLRN